MKKSILINTIPLLAPLTGIGRYIWEICSRIDKNYVECSDFEFKYYYGFLTKKLILQKDVKQLFHPVIRKYLKKVIYKASNLFFSKRCDLYWEPNNVPMDLFKPKKIVTTIHDLSVFLYPHWHPKERVIFFNENKKNINKSDLIITVSNYIKNEIMEYFKIKEERIKVIYLGYYKSFRAIEKEKLSSLFNKYNVNFKFILFVGSVEPRKNLKNVILAYSNLPEKYKREYKLLIVGFKGWENSQVMELINKDKNIKYLGYVDDETLAYLYDKASIFLYPSLYEGFGLPPIEAMACGCPVIVSNVASLPEVCGDAALYVSPDDIDNINHAIQLLLDDSNLREELVKKGVKRTKRFSWDKCAQEHIRAFKKVMDNEF